MINNKYIDSYGIICFNIDNLINISIDKLLDIDLNNINKIISSCNHLNEIINSDLNKIKILMIRRRHSLNYVQFIRGKYTMVNIYKIFKLMTNLENKMILENNFDYLWNELWKNSAKNKNYKKEYLNSKKKFEKLKENNFYDLFKENNLSNYLEPEWEFPKGKKNNNETTLYCAMREFMEETNLKINNINIFKNINFIEEKYKGTDNKYYRHLYYLAISNNNLKLNNIDNISEVGDINWFNYEEAQKKIRPYHLNKINLINNMYNLISNIIKINL